MPLTDDESRGFHRRHREDVVGDARPDEASGFIHRFVHGFQPRLLTRQALPLPDKLQRLFLVKLDREPGLYRQKRCPLPWPRLQSNPDSRAGQ
jgi:hypothetical protein